MTVREVVKALREAGWTISEGARHMKATSPDGATNTTIPRHKGDLKKGTLKAIEKQTGVKL